MTPIDDPAIAALCSELVAMRGRGTRCDVCARVSEDARVDADAIARWCDFKALGDRWREIDRDAAKAILGNVLARDLAYGSTLNADTLAALDADRFLSVVGDAVYFTNGELGYGHGSAGWDPITQATFDTGVIAVGARVIGILWVQDED